MSSDELKQIWDLFEDTPQEIQQRRQRITETLHNKHGLEEFPTQMSIVGALDDLLGCFALGGQIRNYYRYGTHDSCARQREKLWFAVKNGTLYEGKELPLANMSDLDIAKRLRIQEFYKKRLLEDKAHGSSEDVWEERKELLEKPFGK